MNFAVIQQAIDYVDTSIRVLGSCALEDFDDVFAPDGVPLRQVMELFCGLHIDPITNLLTFKPVCQRNPFANFPEVLYGKPSVKSSVVLPQALSMSGMSMSVSGAVNIT
jgi:hypothetical protein